MIKVHFKDAVIDESMIPHSMNNKLNFESVVTTSSTDSQNMHEFRSSSVNFNQCSVHDSAVEKKDITVGGQSKKAIQSKLHENEEQSVMHNVLPKDTKNNVEHREDQGPPFTYSHRYIHIF